MNSDGLIFAIALCRKSGSLAIGFDAATGAAQAGRAQMLLLAEDAADRTAAETRRTGERYGVPVYTLGRTMDQLERGTGRRFAVAAVTGKNQAALVEKNIINQTEETIC